MALQVVFRKKFFPFILHGKVSFGSFQWKIQGKIIIFHPLIVQFSNSSVNSLPASPSTSAALRPLRGTVDSRLNSKAHSPDESNHKMYKFYFNWLHSKPDSRSWRSNFKFDFCFPSGWKQSRWWIPFNLPGSIIASFKLECERQRCFGAHGAGFWRKTLD